MAAALIVFCVMTLFFPLAAAAERWIPERVWRKALEVMHFDE